MAVLPVTNPDGSGVHPISPPPTGADGLRVSLRLLVDVPGDACRREAAVPVRDQEVDDRGVVVREHPRVPVHLGTPCPLAPVPLTRWRRSRPSLRSRPSRGSRPRWPGCWWTAGEGLCAGWPGLRVLALLLPRAGPWLEARDGVPWQVRAEVQRRGVVVRGGVRHLVRVGHLSRGPVSGRDRGRVREDEVAHLRHGRERAHHGHGRRGLACRLRHLVHL